MEGGTIGRKGNLPAAEALDLAEAVAYADGAVVSRVLVSNDGGSLTLFAFDQGEELKEHSSPFDATVLVLDGEALLTIGGKAVRVCAGQVCWMPADVPHAVAAPERFKMLLTMLRGSGGAKGGGEQ